MRTMSARNRCCGASSPAPSISFARLSRAAGCSNSAAPMASSCDEAKRHYDVCGIELAADAAESCRSRGLDVVTGVADAATLDRLGPPFDVDRPARRDRASAAARRDARAVRREARCPAESSYSRPATSARSPRALAGAGWRLMTPPQHLWFFTAESFRRLAPPARPRRRACRSSLENRAALAHSVPGPPHAGLAAPTRGEGEPDRPSGQSVRRDARGVAEGVIRLRSPDIVAAGIRSASVGECGTKTCWSRMSIER